MENIRYKIDNIIELLFINYIKRVCNDKNDKDKNIFVKEITSLIFDKIYE